MTTGRVPISAAALAAVVTAGLILTLFLACSDGTKPASSAPAAPTSSIGKPANTLQDALGQARNAFTASPPFVVHDIESVVYVETTYGQVLNVSRFNPLEPGAADSLPVWVIVAYGEFQQRPIPGSTTPGQTYSTVYAVIPKGQVGLSTGASNEQYDLSQLGTVVQVPVPLPPFPTPVTLNSQ